MLNVLLWIGLICAAAYALLLGSGAFFWLLDRRDVMRTENHAALLAIDVARMHPLDFERHCADVLASIGWTCKTTRASGDFGADVLAEARGTRVVIQVKKWAQPVNLEAVQEVVAAIALYRAQQGVVVSVSGYRPSAVKLARANRVRLLTYRQLFEFTPPTDSTRR